MLLIAPRVLTVGMKCDWCINKDRDNCGVGFYVCESLNVYSQVGSSLCVELQRVS